MINFFSHLYHEVPKPSIMLLTFYFLKGTIYLSVFFNIVCKAIEDLHWKLHSSVLQARSAYTRLSV